MIKLIILILLYNTLQITRQLLHYIMVLEHLSHITVVTQSVKIFAPHTKGREFEFQLLKSHDIMVCSDYLFIKHVEVWI
jgi:hypothetical protein